MSKREYLKNVGLTAIIVFASYLLAVTIRYQIMRSYPGINSLSTPYLLIAALYSILIAFTFDYKVQPRWFQGNGANGIYQIIYKNAVGCLLLLASFYLTGIVFFLRWALFFFWLISSLGLIVKNTVLYSKLARRRCSGQDPYNVLIIGDGRATEDYIQSVANSPQFGIHIVGYMGESNRLETDAESMFEPEKYPEPIIKWLGEFSIEALKFVLRENVVNEIILADHKLSDTMEILKLAQKQGIKINTTLDYSKFIAGEAKIHKIGKSKVVALDEAEKEKSTYTIGVVLSIGILLLLLIMKRLNMGETIAIQTTGKYRCVFFGLLSFFLFLNTGSTFTGKRAMHKRLLLNVVIVSITVVVYELTYFDNIAASIRADMLISMLVLIGCQLIAIAAETVEESFLY